MANQQITVSQAKAKFQELLGKRATQFITSLSVVNYDKLLANASWDSIYQAAITAATLDLPIIFLDQTQIDLIYEGLGLLLESLDSQTDQLLEDGKAIIKDSSYSNSDTGHNLVSDVEYTPEYDKLTDKIDQAQKLSQQFEI